MKVRITKILDEEVDVSTALRARAEEYIKRELESPLRDPDSYTESKPFDLWAAKLLLEIAQLYKSTTLS